METLGGGTVAVNGLYTDEQLLHEYGKALQTHYARHVLRCIYL